MKQRLLYAFLMLLAAAGMVRADVSIKVTSNGGKPVTVTLDQEATVTDLETTHLGKVTLSTDKKTVTLAQGYTTEVEINSTSAITATVTGNMTKLEVADDGKLETLTLGKGNYVKELKVTGSKLQSLTCSGLGMEKLTSASSALKVLDASDNKLDESGGNLNLPTTLEKLNLSKNILSGSSWTVASYTALEELNVSDNLLEGVLGLGSLSNLEKLDLSGNQILSLAANPGKADCAITWGVQTLDVSGLSPAVTANKGVRISALLAEASITGDGKFSDVSWQVQQNNVYVEDNNKTVHQPVAWPGEYRFYDGTTKEFVQGTYQCSLTMTTSGRKYKLSGLPVGPAEFSLSGALPTNASAFTVSIPSVSGGAAQNLASGPQPVKQGESLLFSLTPDAGYETAVYTVKGMIPANSSQQEPYKGTSFEFVVKGLYNDVADVTPQITAVVLGKKHVVAYENATQTGGAFTVEKVSGTTTSNLASKDKIATGEKLLIKIKPKTGYDFKLFINNADKSNDVVVDASSGAPIYTYNEEIANADYPDNTSITVSVAFQNEKVEGTVKADGKDLSVNIDYIVDNKVTIQTPNGTAQNVTDGTAVDLQPNTTYQAIFTTKTVSGTGHDGVYRLKDITINGGELVTVEKDPVVGGMKYTVAFTVKTSDVVISITTKKMTPVSIVPVVNDGSTGQVQTYDGKSKPVLFSTVPANLEKHVKVTYKTTSGNKPVDVPVNADSYLAELTFEETDAYVPDDTDGTKSNFALVIKKAELTIETLPTVTVDRDNSFKVSGGKVTFNGKEIEGTFATTNPSLSVPGQSQKEDVTFTPTLSVDQANFENAKATVNVLVDGSDFDLYKVTMNALPASYTIQWLNGNKTVDISKETFAEGTALTAIITYPKGTKGVELNVTSALSTTTVTKEMAKSTDGYLVYTVEMNENATFTVIEGTGDKYKIKFKGQSTSYTGEPLAYKPETGLDIFDKNNNGVNWATVSTTTTITYKDASGKAVALPIDAGTYTVCVSIAENETAGYIESTAEEAVFTVEKIQAEIYMWPKASVIAKGQVLTQSELTEGVASIPGTFQWVNASKTFSISGEYKEPVVFKPGKGYEKNYIPTETGGVSQAEWVIFKVSDLQIVTFVQTEGTITVTNQLGQTLSTGSAITKGDVLTIKVEPREALELKSLKVNGVDNNGTYTVGASSVAIEATYQPKVVEPEPEKPGIDPNSQYAVTLPKANDVRGVLVNKPGVNAVLKDKPFSFTLNTLPADAEKVIVKVNGTELKPVNGTYTIASVTQNTSVQISLANPTSLKVSVETVTKNENGNVMGKVQVNGLVDGICYFNDVITLVAYPESGVLFNGWSDDKEVKSQLRTLTLTRDVTIKPLFSGIPTGIGSIVTARMYSTEGFLVIEGITQGKVTIIGMDGRIQRQQISGDSRIQLAGGVYGVILEDGSKVIRTKVIVK